MVLHWLAVVAWICVLTNGCAGLCTLPSALQGVWDSSDKGQLNITSMDISGYTVHDFGTFTFTCEMQDGDKYIVKSQQFQRYNLPFNVYLCMIFTQVTRVSSGELYTYYLAADPLADAGYERVHVWHNSRTLTSSADICTVSNFAGVPYSVLMMNGSIDNVITMCPIPLLGNFAYTFDTGSGNLCNDSYVEVCNTKTTMNWNYTACSQIQAYSTSGVTKCVHSTVDNSTGTDVYTTHVYNTDVTTDRSTTYRFTCYITTGYQTVYATQAPGDCQTGQNTTYVASPGATLVLNSSAVCAYDITTTAGPTDGTDSVLPAGVVAAIVLLLLLLLVVVIIALIFYYYKKRKRRKEEEYAAANRKIDPDELSPNMRLGLPDESRYDLDRLMFSPELRNGNLKKEKGKNIIGLDAIEGFNEAGMYMDESQRQTALESHMFTEKRKRKDNKDEFQAGEQQNKQFSARIKEMSKGRKRPIKATALAKLRLRPRPKPIIDQLDATYSGTKPKDIVIQVEEADTDNKRKTRFADELQQSELDGGLKPEVTVKPLEEVETLSDIVDNEMGVADLSDDDIGPRLKLPSLRPERKQRSKRAKDRFSLGSNQPTSDSMPLNTRFMPPKPKQKHPQEEYIEQPVVRTPPNTANLSYLARIHKKDKALKKAMENMVTEDLDIETLRSRMSDSKWRRLLEELYADKKYFDYVKKSSSPSEKDLFSISKEGLQYLYGRAMFWEQQQPIPVRPPSHLRRLFSRQDSVKPKSTKGLVRSSTTRSSYKRLPRTPSTQVSRLPRTPSTQVSRLTRTPSTQVSRLKTRDKQSKDEANAKAKMKDVPISNGVIPDYFEGSTQTDFSPIPLSPIQTPLSQILAFNEDADTDNGSMPGSILAERDNMPTPMPLIRDVTKTDIKLEGLDMDYSRETIGHRLLVPSPIKRDVTKSDIILEECDGDYNHETIGKDFNMAV